MGEWDLRPEVGGTTILMESQLVFHTISKCNARSVSYELIHEYSWRPDAKLGTQALSCSRTGSRYWGRQVEGDYHVVIRGISGRASVSVNDFRIKY